MKCGLHSPNWELITHITLSLISMTIGVGLFKGKLTAKQGMLAHISVMITGILVMIISAYLVSGFP